MFVGTIKVVIIYKVTESSSVAVPEPEPPEPRIIRNRNRRVGIVDPVLTVFACFNIDFISNLSIVLRKTPVILVYFEKNSCKS